MLFPAFFIRAGLLLLVEMSSPFVPRRLPPHPQVVFKPLLSYTGIQAQDTTPLSYKMYFGEHLSFSGNLECLRADIVDSDTSKERKNKRSRR